MKSILLCALALIAASAASAQTVVTYSAEYVSHSQSDPVVSNGTLMSAPWWIFFSQKGSDGSIRVSPVAPTLSVDLVQHQNDTIVVGGLTITVGQLLQALQVEITSLRTSQVSALNNAP